VSVTRSVRYPASSSAVPGEQQRGVAVAVGLEGAAAAVVRPAVDLDDEPLSREHEVALVAGEVVVDLRLREAVRATDREEERFEA
jgi:hypothetical protein